MRFKTLWFIVSHIYPFATAYWPSYTMGGVIRLPLQHLAIPPPLDEVWAIGFHSFYSDAFTFSHFLGRKWIRSQDSTCRLGKNQDGLVILANRDAYRHFKWQVWMGSKTQKAFTLSETMFGQVLFFSPVWSLFPFLVILRKELCWLQRRPEYRTKCRIIWFDIMESKL